VRTESLPTLHCKFFPSGKSLDASE
jgi:hypothetical protein